MKLIFLYIDLIVSWNSPMISPFVSKWEYTFQFLNFVRSLAAGSVQSHEMLHATQIFVKNLTLATILTP